VRAVHIPTEQGVSMKGKQQDVEKERYWQETIREAVKHSWVEVGSKLEF
jgi:hypothetical protein